MTRGPSILLLSLILLGLIVVAVGILVYANLPVEDPPDYLEIIPGRNESTTTNLLHLNRTGLERDAPEFAQALDAALNSGSRHVVEDPQTIQRIMDYAYTMTKGKPLSFHVQYEGNLFAVNHVKPSL